MQHIAIMKSQWKLIDKIVSGEKKIESRWYMARYAPWNKIRVGDIIYFKDSGKPVTAKAVAENVLQFEDYSEEELKEIFSKYSRDITLVSPIEEEFEWAKKRKYCILIFLKNPQRIEQFKINKKGFGNACAWLCIDDVDKIKQSVLRTTN